MRRLRRCLLTALLLRSGLCLAQEPPPASAPASTNASSPHWSYNLSLAGYLVPQDQSYASPTFTADGAWTHLEARYNYEGLQTASLWFGYDFSVGKKFQLEFTPMIGGVFGKTNGIAPGYELTISYRRVQLYSASEYVFDTGNRNNSFFYTWTEIGYSPVKWFRLGAAAQRTRIYQTGLDVQRGPLVGVSFKKTSFTTYVFNPGWTQPTWVFSLSYSF